MRDMDDVFKLLSIAEKAVQWPKLKAIHDSAMSALEAHAKDIASPEPEPAEPAVKIPGDPGYEATVRRPNLSGDSNGKTDSK